MGVIPCEPTCCAGRQGDSTRWPAVVAAVAAEHTHSPEWEAPTRPRSRRPFGLGAAVVGSTQAGSSPPGPPPPVRTPRDYGLPGATSSRARAPPSPRPCQALARRATRVQRLLVGRTRTLPHAATPGPTARPTRLPPRRYASSRASWPGHRSRRRAGAFRVTQLLHTDGVLVVGRSFGRLGRGRRHHQAARGARQPPGQAGQPDRGRDPWALHERPRGLHEPAGAAGARGADQNLWCAAQPRATAHLPR